MSKKIMDTVVDIDGVNNNQTQSFECIFRWTFAAQSGFLILALIVIWICLFGLPKSVC